MIEEHEEELTKIKAELAKDKGAMDETKEGNELEQVREELRRITEERVALREPPSELPSDFPSLARELLRVQGQLSAAQSQKDVHAFQRAASEHAVIASAPLVLLA